MLSYKKLLLGAYIYKQAFQIMLVVMFVSLLQGTNILFLTLTK